MRKMIWYVAGGMADYADGNKQAFNQAALSLRMNGYETRNPVENGVVSTNSADHMRADFLMIMESDGVAVLPGGGFSSGVQAEISLARSLKLPVLPYGHVNDYSVEIIAAFNAKHADG